MKTVAYSPLRIPYTVIKANHFLSYLDTYKVPGLKVIVFASVTPDYSDILNTEK